MPCTGSKALAWAISALAAAILLVLAGFDYRSPALAQSAAQTTVKQPRAMPAPPQRRRTVTRAARKTKYEPVTFADLPEWDADDHLAALRTFQKSCAKLIEKARRGKETSAAGDQAALINACNALEKLPGKLTRKTAKTYFEANFTPHRVRYKGPASILTGYYEPELNGSRTATGKFQTPLYKRPPDLINLVSEADRGGVGANFTHARKTAKGIVPFPKRSEIEQGALNGKGLELLYVEDPVEAFFLHIQGSGRIRLRDGTSIRITYDGKNGHPYSSIGRYLIRKGVMGAETMSLELLGDWLKADRERGRKVMWHNASFVFFRELQGAEAAGAHGVMSIQLTPGRSLAIDPSYHRLGLPIYVSAPSLMHVHKTRGFHRLMVGQDVGSAIKGPERGDIFFGSGAAAGRLAGVTKESGRFYVLLPRTDLPAAAKPRSGQASKAAGRTK